MMMLRIERALGMLRMDLVQRAAQADWDDDQAEQVAHAVVACLRTGRAAPDDHAPAPGATLTGAALRAWCGTSMRTSTPSSSGKRSPPPWDWTPSGSGAASSSPPA